MSRHTAKYSAERRRNSIIVSRLYGRKGSSYLGTIFEVFIILILLAAMMSVFPLFMQKYSLDMAANDIADYIGLSGCTGEYTFDESSKAALIQALSQEYGVSLDDFSLEIDSQATTQTVSDTRGTLVQLGGRFEVTLTAIRSIGIGGIVPDIPITLTSSAMGRSEVYWKTLAVSSP